MRAALLMLGSTMAFGLMAVAIRYATRYVPTQEVAFFRNAFGLLALLPMLLRPGRAPLKTQQLPRYFVRSAIGLGSMLCAFWALGHLPLAQAVSLSIPRRCSSPSPPCCGWAKPCACAVGRQ